MWLNLVRIGSESDIEENEDYYQALTEREFHKLAMSDVEYEMLGNVHVPVLSSHSVKEAIKERGDYLEGFPDV